MHPAQRIRGMPGRTAPLTLLCAVLAAARASADTQRLALRRTPPTTRQTAGVDVLLRLDPDGPLDRTDWPVRLGVEAGVPGEFLVLGPAPPDVPEARLVSRPLSPRTTDGPWIIELRARAERRTPPVPLLIELGDAGGVRFRTIGRLDPQETNDAPFRVRIDPPAHDWRLRLRVPPGGGRWRIRRLVVRATLLPDQGSLRIDAMPIRPYQVRAATREGVVYELVLPARLDPQPGLSLLAPARVGQWVFWRWELDGVPQPPRERVLRVDPARAWEALARYRPAPGETVTLRVEAVPDPGERPRVRVAGVPLQEASMPGAYELLPGEPVTVEAPSRTTRALLDHWELDGGEIEGAGPRLELRPAADAHLTAVYVLLGDMNGDGRVNRDDVDIFVLALADPDAYARRFPELDRVRRGDMNGDGVLDWADIERFVDQILRARP